MYIKLEGSKKERFCDGSFFFPSFFFSLLLFFFGSTCLLLTSAAALAAVDQEGRQAAVWQNYSERTYKHLLFFDAWVKT